MKERLPALQGIRALATIGIFLFHSGFLFQGTFPVTLFFMLSGFLIYYNEGTPERYKSYREWLGGYVFRKLKTFYPLHLVTFVIALFVGRVFVKEITAETVISGFLNLTLIHPWVRQYAIGFNGLSWYLAITVFLYIVGYYLIKLTKKIKRAIPVVCIVLFVICGLSFASRFSETIYLYTNPAYRILDFLLGMLCAKVFTENDYSIRNYETLEIAIVIIFIIQYAISLFIEETPGYYSILFAIALPVFAEGKGIVSRFLKCKAFDRIAYYSFEFYMIHELMLRIFRKVFTDESIFYPIRCAMIAFPALILSALFAVAWKKMIIFMKKKKRSQ